MPVMRTFIKSMMRGIDPEWTLSVTYKHQCTLEEYSRRQLERAAELRMSHSYFYLHGVAKADGTGIRRLW